MYTLRPSNIGKVSYEKGNNIKCSINNRDDYIGMWEYNYQFEGSSEIRKFKDDRSWMTSEAFCECILKSIFKGQAPCGLTLLHSKKNISNNDTLEKPVIVMRDYAQKFKYQKPQQKVVLKKKKRRWKSPKVKRRWRSRSPKVRKITIK